MVGKFEGVGIEGSVSHNEVPRGPLSFLTGFESDKATTAIEDIVSSTLGGEKIQQLDDLMNRNGHFPSVLDNYIKSPDDDNEDVQLLEALEDLRDANDKEASQTAIDSIVNLLNGWDV